MADDFASAENSVENRCVESNQEQWNLEKKVDELKGRLEESEKESKELEEKIAGLFRGLEESEIKRWELKDERKDLERRLKELKNESKELEDEIEETGEILRGLEKEERRRELIYEEDCFTDIPDRLEHETAREYLEYDIERLSKLMREEAREISGTDQSTKGPYVEPCNCEMIGVVYLPTLINAEKEARDYYLQRPKQNCCTIYGCQVTKWSLPSPSSPLNMVKLKKAAAGVYFLCHLDLDVEWLEESKQAKNNLELEVRVFKIRLEESEKRRKALENRRKKLERGLEESENESKELEDKREELLRRFKESENKWMELHCKKEELERKLSEVNWGEVVVESAAETCGPDRSTKGPYVEPCNCEMIGVVYLPNEIDALQAARDYYSQKPKQNCCTIYGCQVTKWSLPSPSSPHNMVKVKKAAVGVYFLCHIDLDVEW